MDPATSDPSTLAFRVTGPTTSPAHTVSPGLTNENFLTNVLTYMKVSQTVSWSQATLACGWRNKQGGAVNMREKLVHREEMDTVQIFGQEAR